MGLDTTHGAWHGAYSAFHRWRVELAKLAGLPPLELMDGYYDNDHFSLLEYAHPNPDDLAMSRLRRLKEELPLKWEALKPDGLHILLLHSDCEGTLKASECKKIADSLTKLIPKIPEDMDLGGHIGNMRQKTQTFIDGCMEAYNAKEKMRFQ